MSDQSDRTCDCGQKANHFKWQIIDKTATRDYIIDQKQATPIFKNPKSTHANYLRTTRKFFKTKITHIDKISASYLNHANTSMRGLSDQTCGCVTRYKRFPAYIIIFIEVCFKFVLK